jgi:predicted HicB family RNase H-like nuclease
MAQENLGQVAVRMSPRLHTAAKKMAKREKMSFGEFVRQAVDSHVEALKKWTPTQESGWMTYKKGHITR